MPAGGHFSVAQTALCDSFPNPKTPGHIYPELGGGDQQKKMYAEGDTYTHPSGAVYQPSNGNRKCIKRLVEAQTEAEGSV